MAENPQTAPHHEGHAGQGPVPHAAVALDKKPERRHMLPVWYFVGIILFVYGLLILATGLYEFSKPSSTVLGELHPAIWWGALMTVIGAIYIYLFHPRNP